MRRFALLVFTFIFILIFNFNASASDSKVASGDAALDSILKRYSSGKNITDWEAIALGVNGIPIKSPLLSTNYFKRTENEVKKANGEFRVVTDYARIAVAWRANGRDAGDVAGYDFIDKIKIFKNIQNQGINGYIWSLIALCGFEAEITEPFVESILKYQRPSGGFAAALPTASRPDPKADIDLTAMAVTALAPYSHYENVEAAINTVVGFLSEAQFENGGYAANEKENAESVCQVIIALCSVGIDLNDERFVKNKNTLASALERFRLRDGTYAHSIEDKLKSDPIATRQAALALSAIKRARNFESASEEERDQNKMKRGIFEL